MSRFIQPCHTLKPITLQLKQNTKNVCKTAVEIRQYWEEQNRERFAMIAAMPPKPGQEALRAKLQAWKARIEAQS